MIDKINNQPLRPITPPPRTQEQKTPPKAGGSFQDILTQEKSRLEFSKHAQKRLDARNISISPADLERLENGVQLAASKGSRDSLILVDNVAYVVSVKNSKIITAVDAENMKNNVFTNIDSAVIMD